MIAITNISKRVRATGLHTYEVAVTVINMDKTVSKRPICQFRHRREDGMSVCLEKASKAVKESGHDEMMRLLMALDPA